MNQLLKTSVIYLYLDLFSKIEDRLNVQHGKKSMGSLSLSKAWIYCPINFSFMIFIWSHLASVKCVSNSSDVSKNFKHMNEKYLHDIYCIENWHASIYNSIVFSSLRTVCLHARKAIVFPYYNLINRHRHNTHAQTHVWKVLRHQHVWYTKNM